jgi:hypothetical protein
VRFEVEGAAPIDNPTPEQVEQGLRTLEPANRDYAILEQQASTYLQTAPNGDGTYLLEFQDGSLDQHYRASRPLQLDDLIGAFGAYRRQDASWRSRYEWQKIDATPHPAPPRPHRERRQMSRGRIFARLGVGLVWGLVELVILGAFFVAGGLVGALGFLVAPSIYGLPLSIGFVAGIVAGLMVNHHARLWLLHLRVRLLRRRGQHVMASVMWVDDQYAASGRGPGTMTCTVFVRWQDPVSGDDHEYDRQYRFWGNGSKHFEALVDEPSVPVLYAPGRPSRFVIDIPFAPTMADFVLSESPGQVQAASGPAAPPARRPAASVRRSVFLIGWYTVLGLICLIFGVEALGSGIQATRAGTAGVPGRVLVTTCTGRDDEDCSGLFTPSGSAGLPSTVSIEGPYRTPAVVNDVRLLNGQAYRPAGDMIATLLVDYVVGVFLLAGAVSCGAMIFRRPRVAPEQGRTGGGQRRPAAHRAAGQRQHPHR